MWNELAREIHQNAIEHGWWEKERSFGGIIALCHSELSEALEEYRDGKAMIYGTCAMDPDGCEHYYLCDSPADNHQCKPEGIAVELADCIIRILDHLGKEQIDIDDEMEKAEQLNIVKPFDTFIADLHLQLSFAYIGFVGEVCCIKTIMAWAKVNNIDMLEIIRIKHAYNKTRPYRHGGKKC